MILIEQSAVPAAALPVQAFKEHLRLASGFADDGDQDALLEQHLRAAIAAIEARTGKVTISRDFQWTLHDWRDAGEQALPVAPVTEVTGMSVFDRTGSGSVIDPGRYMLLPDGHRPKLMPSAGVLPMIPEGGTVDVRFKAGFGAEWGDLPADLAQAILLLAARYHDHGDEAGRNGAMPQVVNLLIQRYRTVRVLGGRGRT